ncbi:deleted in malignant brain tumors 1 protein-like isoform X4 [Ruditapes philippinarum]|uniref:deleted in malignant brain tumors 1 protein-like isoform X4 n=1 Tax=Ruditapes philippinarum TaxID=129788 RepID=UPI00295B92DB|nr:deleted in malignant brain tumors 1 protein-like isoform X4 [Ruditapes philippinarum]
MVYWYESLFLYIVSFLVQTQGIDPSCECVTFQSYGLSTGQFHSPDYPIPYQRGINCILYNFVGDVNEIVEIKFLDMDLKGPVPIGLSQTQCRDWLRIYKNLDRGEINENVRHQDELCGSLTSLEDKKFYSSGRALIMEFHTDTEESTRRFTGFKGRFTFLDKSAFKTDGILRYGTQCTYDIQNRTKGKFFSPRYPQKYPKSSDCQFMFMGNVNERVKVLFKLINLPNRSCGENGDMIRVYDGSDKSAKLLHTFCDNTHNQETFESSGQYMYIEFHSDRHYEAQGFAADYEFIDTREGGSPVPSDSMYTQLFLKH